MLSIRAVHVLQGLTCILGARKAYRRPAVAAALEVAAAAELGLLARRTLRQGHYDSQCARADAAFGLVGLVGLAAATAPEDRTSSVNWMLPLTVGSCLGASSLENPAEGIGIAAALATAYTVTTARSIGAGGGKSASAMANALSYPGFYAVGRLVIGFTRRMADQVDEARQQAIEQRAAAAAAEARLREHRLLHDSALQTLEAIGRREDMSPLDIRQAARREAAALRRALSGEPALAEGDLLSKLSEVADAMLHHDLTVELIADVGDLEPSAAVAAALSAAAGEALMNVAKHAGTHKAVLRAVATGAGWRVTVRDHGSGFDVDGDHVGFGLGQSIRHRIEEIGGTVSVTSSPGSGTKVEMWVPA
jgi:signal transduction histidine kinase